MSGGAGSPVALTDGCVRSRAVLHGVQDGDGAVEHADVRVHDLARSGAVWYGHVSA